MKKLLLLFVLLSSLTAIAQTSPDNISGDSSRPANLSVVQALLTRIHTLGIDDKIRLMKANGITEAKHSVTFNASGALLYDHEIAGEDFFNNKSVAGRNAGLQVIPYTLSISTDGRVYISTSAVAFKNMNAEMQDDDLNMEAGVFKIIDNIEVAKIEYSKNMNSIDIEELHIRGVQIDAKVGIIEGLPDNQFLAFKGGVSPVGYHKTTVTLLTNDKKTLEGFESSVRYGLEYNVSLKKGWRLNAEIIAGNQWSLNQKATRGADTQAAYDNEMAEIILDEQNAPNTHCYDCAVSALNNKYLESTKRSYMYIAPRIELSKKISKENKSPVRLGIQFSGNITVQDRMSRGGVNLDLQRNNPSMFNTGIFLNF